MSFSATLLSGAPQMRKGYAGFTKSAQAIANPIALIFLSRLKAVPEDAPIRTSISQYCPRSPCTFSVARKTAFTAVAEKPGYKTGSVEITTKVQGGAAGYAGNVILGGVIGRR